MAARFFGDQFFFFSHRFSVGGDVPQCRGPRIGRPLILDRQMVSRASLPAGCSPSCIVRADISLFRSFLLERLSHRLRFAARAGYIATLSSACPIEGSLFVGSHFYSGTSRAQPSGSMNSKPGEARNPSPPRIDGVRRNWTTGEARKPWWFASEN